jgi:hypothetical protein
MVTPTSPAEAPLATSPATGPAAPPASLPGASLAEAPRVVASPPRAVEEPRPEVERSPAPPQPAGDLSSYIEARRRARGELGTAQLQDSPPQNASSSAPRGEDERERRNRIVAANLGLQRTPTAGYDPKGGGGIFELQRMSRDSAEFIFFGWNKDLGRNFKQLIEVDRGDNSDIRLAVVRKMIAIIREDVSGDFLWVSQRLGRSMMLSARLRDNAELEAFMLDEFFPDPRRVN